jgi:protein required for attachment to host cells
MYAMKMEDKIPQVYAAVANARGARLYGRRKSRVFLLAALRPQQKPFKAREIALWLEKEIGKDHIDRLVLIAPAAFLKALQKAITPQVYHHVAAEIKKDLLDGNEVALQSELKKILWF